jgi:hypothetical protein
MVAKVVRLVKRRDFSLPETALILGVSESYLKKLDSNWGEVHLALMRRNLRGEPVYSVTDIEVMQKVGIGRRKRPLNRLHTVMGQMGVRSFGTIGPPPEEMAREQELLRTAIPAAEWLKRKRAEEQEGQERPLDEQEPSQRPWWRRVFGG